MPEPRDPAGADVVLEVTRAAICGTDASEFDARPEVLPDRRAPPVQRPSGADDHGPRVHRARGRARPGVRRPEHRGPRRVRRRRVLREVRVVPARAHEPVRALLHARPPHPRRASAQYVRTLDLALSGSVPETCSDDAAAMAQPLAVALHALRPQRSDAEAVGRRDRRRRHRIVPDRRRRRLRLRRPDRGRHRRRAARQRARPGGLARREREARGRRAGDPRRDRRGRGRRARGLGRAATPRASRSRPPSAAAPS